MTDLRGKSVGIVGAGFGGIGMGIRLRESGVEDFQIYESGDEVGGVWRANAYPGAACDVPSHLYSFSFAPGSKWSRRYAPREEILEYLRDLVAEHDLAPKILLGTSVESASFDAEAGKWELRSSDGESRRFDFLVTACGQLRNPSIPSIPGIEDFAGEAFHSAEWDAGCDLDGKRVAVLGTGASAIQFVPEIASKVAHLDIYQRSAPWILPKLDRRYPDWERRLFERFPARVAISRAAFFEFFELFTYAFTGQSWMMKPMAAGATAFRKKSFKGRPDLLEKVTPDYVMGCKRVLFSNDWYPTLRRENVELLTAEVERVTAAGVVASDGVERPADVIIWGTGFRSGDFVAPMAIRGLDGRELNEVWAGSPEAYLGTTVTGFPNFFVLYGPNTNHGSGSVPYLHECQYRYALDAMARVVERESRYLDLDPEVQQRWRREMDERSRDTVWLTGGCGNWYLNAEGRNTNNWPAAWREYRRRTTSIDPAEYRFA